MPTLRSTPGPIYQLKITLDRARPPIWRRVLVPRNIRLSKLHNIIQYAFSWTDSHLHRFEAGGQRYERPDPGYRNEGVKNEDHVRLDQVASVGSKVSYEYDFGDNWSHTLLVENALPADVAQLYPVCIGGKRAGPPDDCGGVWGYASLLEALSDPDHENHRDMVDWMGGDFDPEAFDVERVNQAFTGRKNVSLAEFASDDSTRSNHPTTKSRKKAIPDDRNMIFGKVKGKTVVVTMAAPRGTDEATIAYADIASKLQAIGPTRAIERSLNEFLERYPRFAQAYDALAEVLDYQGRTEEADEVRERKSLEVY